MLAKEDVLNKIKKKQVVDKSASPTFPKSPTMTKNTKIQDEDNFIKN